MVKLTVYVGLPASGKSTHAKELSERDGSILLSSDKIREELYGDESTQVNSNEVFDFLYKRANELLRCGKNVIIDATNINRKKRIHMIKNAIKADEYICYYITTPRHACLMNDSIRNRKVGKFVIDKMYKNMQVPLMNEGWDDIIFVYNDKANNTYNQGKFIELVHSDLNHEDLFDELSDIDPVFHQIFNLPHDSKYHTYSVSRHTYHTYKYIYDNYTAKYKSELLIASLLHDIGKGYCKVFKNMKGEDTNCAHYYYHEYVGSQMAVRTLYNLGFNDETIKLISTLVQLHMIPHDMSDKQEKKLRELIDPITYEMLMVLNEADLQAH